ncbi:MAG TPA: TlpA disulfide reductase family protein [Arenibacter sp.]|nr:TlpA disulfide reductase family protein [Arenibacter sp.]
MTKITHFITAILFCLLMASCGESKTELLNSGIWRAELQTMNGQVLPFNFKVDHLENGKYTLEIYNAEETIYVDEVSVTPDSIIIKLPVYEGYITGSHTLGEIKGKFVVESLGRSVPFTAVYGQKDRFGEGMTPKSNITGDWETEFSPGMKNSYMAKGIFKQIDDKVTGTFRTVTGDYRYLEGVHHGDSLTLSTFDGSRAYLFTAKVSGSTMEGMFYSGNHFREPFRAKRNENFELPRDDTFTFIKEGYDKLDFSFPDAEGKIISLQDSIFKDKVTIVQLMGTWCPNCLDETKFLVEYLKENEGKEVGVVALAFEYAKTPEAAFKAIDRLKERIGVGYPILLAQYATTDKSRAQEKLPMLNHVFSYPTTIIMDRKGEVRKIHTGFNGPATGNNYISFKKDFNSFISQLLAEE